jgi:hypothetical protein
MNVLPEMRAALVAAAERRYLTSASPPAPTGPRVPRLRRWRPLALILVIVLAGGTGALAATGVIPFGRPVPVPHYKFGAHAVVQGSGVVEAASVRLEAQAADPAGGLPWAMRLAKTSHHLGCLEVGRLEDGQIGIIGEHGAFGNDDRFHPLPLGVLATWGACQPLDASGQLVVNAEAGLVTTAGDAIGLAPGDCSPPMTHGKHIHYCPITDERYLFYGLLGPQATHLTYVDARGVTQTLTPSGPDGAYMIVERAEADGDGPGTGGYNSGGSIGLLPGSPIVSVTYRDGLRCDYATSEQPKGACAHPPGYKAPAIPDYTHAQLASSVQATAHHDGTQGWYYTVSLVARAPLTNTLSNYLVSLSIPPAGCTTGAEYVGNVTRGQRITIRSRQVPGAAGRYHGAVYFASNPQGRPLGTGPGGPGRHVLVGRFTLTVPPHYYRPGSISGCS